jgi:hypothetical protein
VIEMPLIGDPPNKLAAVSLIRAAIADHADSGIFHHQAKPLCSRFASL